MSEAIELTLVIDGPVLKGVRRWAQIENFDGCRPDDYEPTTEELAIAAREMLAECAGRQGCDVCGAPRSRRPPEILPQRQSLRDVGGPGLVLRLGTRLRRRGPGRLSRRVGQG